MVEPIRTLITDVSHVKGDPRGTVRVGVGFTVEGVKGAQITYLPVPFYDSDEARGVAAMLSRVMRPNHVRAEGRG